MRVLCFVGTRPNFIKMAALYKQISRQHNMKSMLVHSGQHYDKNMSEVFFTDLDLPKPDVCLDVSGGSHTYQTAQIMERFEPVLKSFSPDIVIVVGDVNSTLAASLVACQCNIPIAHVEAGLRSRDRTMPEEINRILVDQISDFLFVTEQSGIDNLKMEGIPESKIFFVGNVMIDTLLTHIKKTDKSNVLIQVGLSSGSYALVTLHRPANSDNPEALEDILNALVSISKDIHVLLPIHPRTRKRIQEFGFDRLIADNERFHIIDPLGYIDFLAAMKNARVVITDSGGIQEETTILGVPCLTMRNNTERPITIESGTNTLVGTKGDNVVEAFRALPPTGSSIPKQPPLWDGNAAARIIEILVNSIK